MIIDQIISVTYVISLNKYIFLYSENVHSQIQLKLGFSNESEINNLFVHTIDLQQFEQSIVVAI